ncbi:MOSC domain-containing protein [Aspergillus lucknowensis]|uniref:MOSC domain-containing protein n=1 Tax=Aspergillus lucknowensis TaxID=176173 RepID=A0ABR4M2F5_9EURO
MTPLLYVPLLLLLALTPWLLPALRSNNQTSTLRRLLRLGKKTPSQKPSEILSLRVYPIKSCRGFEVPSSKLRTTGLDLDRRWMLVDATTHVFLTIRQIPEMTRILTGISDDGEELLLSTADIKDEKAEIAIPSRPSAAWLEENTTLASDVQIWDTVTDGYIYNPSVGVNQLFSKFLNRDVVLVYKGPTARILKGNGDPRLLGRVQSTNFPDVHPVLIASQASIDELNSRLKSGGHEAITIERFRPNIIIRGDREAPWVEDSWKTVRISSPGTAGGEGEDGASLTFDIVARCGRCQVPNVDPVTAEKHRTQPWDTMMSYRRVDPGLKYKPCFGMLGAPRGEGEVRVGMKFEVLEETTGHQYIKGF